MGSFIAPFTYEDCWKWKGQAKAIVQIQTVLVSLAHEAHKLACCAESLFANRAQKEFWNPAPLPEDAKAREAEENIQLVRIEADTVIEVIMTSYRALLAEMTAMIKRHNGTSGIDLSWMSSKAQEYYGFQGVNLHAAEELDPQAKTEAEAMKARFYTATTVVFQALKKYEGFTNLNFASISLISFCQHVLHGMPFYSVSFLNELANIHPNADIAPNANVNPNAAVATNANVSTNGDVTIDMDIEATNVHPQQRRLLTSA